MNYDCVGNVTGVLYPDDSNSTLRYQYNDYAQVQGIDLTNPLVGTLNILQNGQYDLFDQLAAYDQSGNFHVVREQTIEGHLRYAGPADRIGSPVKHYLGHWNPDALVNMDVKRSDGSNVQRMLEYTASGELARTTYVAEGVKHTNELTYDEFGNLKTLSLDGTGYTLEYLLDRVTKVKKKDGTLVSSMAYLPDGFMTSLTGTSTSYKFTPDDMFDEKVSVMEMTGASPRKDYMSYDCMGNLLSETYQKLLYKIYIYGGGNQLAYQYTNDKGFGTSSLYIYCGDLLVSQYDVRGDQVHHLVYDNMNTLLLQKDVVIRTDDPLNQLFGEPADSMKGQNITFHYGGMYYIEDFGVYENDGRIYFPQIGVTNSPSLSPIERFYTPYRKFGNNPLQ